MCKNVRLGFQDIENALEKIVETGIFESGDIVDQYALEAALTYLWIISALIACAD